MRLFFALEPGPETAMRIAQWRDRQFGRAGRAVPPANFHVTLAFLGELRQASLERLEAAVDRRLASGEFCSDRLELDITGYWQRPGVYWLGASACPDSLARLARALAGIGAALGCRRDTKAFQPHITLFRGLDVAPPAPALAPCFELSFAHFVLFESRQGRQGVSYHPLRDWELPPSR